MFAVVVQWLSHVQLFETSRAAAYQASLSFTIFWSLLTFMSTQLVMLSNHFILVLLPSVFSSIRVFSNELALCIRWPKYWPKYSMFRFNLLLVDPVWWSEFPRSGCCDLEVSTIILLNKTSSPFSLSCSGSPMCLLVCLMRPHELHDGASLIAQLVKNPPAMQEILVWFLGQEDLLEKG